MDIFDLEQKPRYEFVSPCGVLDNHTGETEYFETSVVAQAELDSLTLAYSQTPEFMQKEKDMRDDSKLYYQATNEHGHPQTYAHASYFGGGKDFPVCSNCYCHVMLNRGSGTICDSCTTDDIIESQHDYDDESDHNHFLQTEADILLNSPVDNFRT